jgi:hypothetical protein
MNPFLSTPNGFAKIVPYVKLLRDTKDGLMPITWNIELKL